MKFLDLNGLKHLLKFIDRTVSVKVSSFTDPNTGICYIPFVTNHQIIQLNDAKNIDVYNWFKDASEGGILEIIPMGAQGGNFYCPYQGPSLIYKMISGEHGPYLKNIDYLQMRYNNYIRLIKSNGKLVVAEYVINN